MRLVAVLALALAGCEIAGAGDQAVEPPGLPMMECAVDLDCVGASSTCCECPSFALPVSSGWQTSCDQVMCDPAPACSEVAAVCQAGACVLACQPITCDLPCADGFAVDAAGCQVCACAAPAADQCAVDADCARVPADCCGCGRGGADTAVPVGQVDAHNQALDCGGAACPEIDVCTPDLAARCVAGTCALTDAPVAAPAADACGRADLPTCAHCVLNAGDAYAAAGLGRCAP